MIHARDIFSIQTEADFERQALKVFKFQFENNSVYRSFCDLLYIHPSTVSKVEDIPFLPIQFFKSHEVISSQQSVQETFTSSGTTGSITSKHLVTDCSVYEESYINAFKHFYGPIEDYVILALLPNYLEREGSSLIYMVDDLIKRSKQPDSGFYLNQYEQLKTKINQLEAKGQKTLLIGVTFALLTLIETYQFQLQHTTIMETGGMKGMRKELIREELHQVLTKGFGVDCIHSEYGMTELLSQAYSKGNGIFKCPSWMKVITRDPEDALSIQKKGKTGGLNIIDLANFNSCSFIATQDLGKVHPNGCFEVVGRFDASDIRGCNLMAL
ncbi:LuxE/PaaK family acyltransferase [Aurantibacter aestuarii]|uniref:Acyl transferase n=1 Tax=Aurantibacter aestuarii TaxID=1266046 RepID=A0A2T1NCB5_9FLAO|nr:acyl transferase [Aurantibacter aestuarii]PSG90082.1 acyl transferase [Aurantibacter aestuarii]